MAQPATLVNDLRACNDRLLDALDEAAALRRQWDALGGQVFVDPFFEANPTYDFTAEEMGTAFASLEAISGFVAEGHATNLNKVR
jgi:hypothetical protein